MHDHRPFSLLQQLKRFELQSDIGGLFPHQCEANMGDRLCEPGVTGSSWMWWEGGLQIVGGSGSLGSRWPPTPTWSPTTSSFSSCLPITPTPPPICSNLLICPLVATCKCSFAAGSMLPFQGIPHSSNMGDSQFCVSHCISSSQSFIYLRLLVGWLERIQSTIQ